ncbi:ATP-binding cassette domain-containing protein [Lutispora thermophila]|uniref:ABC transporter n=1 Tax=Lutispora thermophila DSM 19022 TaxID=1122184 RepID=A0A1M6H1N0_9FIRM|nr:ABC transporter [Lutispora thermophila DSM 19022]
MESSIYPESFARLLLARLLFRGDEVYKKVHVLSGGEQVKVSFAKMLLQDINLLILDEPTNYMDINSLEVMEESLREYNGTLLFVSHDRRFVDALADHIMTIEDMKIRMFSGNYAEYLEKRKKSGNETKEDIEKQVLLLRNRLSEVIGRLSMPSKNDDVEALNKEYFKIMDELRELDNILKSF